MLKARTHRPILRGLAVESPVESADSIPESVNSTTDFTIVRLPTVGVGRREMHLKCILRSAYQFLIRSCIPSINVQYIYLLHLLISY